MPCERPPYWFWPRVFFLFQLISVHIKEISYLQELNDVQREAVTALEGPVMVIAGPGSGKTRVLTYRIAHLINQGVPPWEILALTFTNKAAREMKERIEKVVGSGAQRVWAGTFTLFLLKYSEEKHIGLVTLMILPFMIPTTARV